MCLAMSSRDKVNAYRARMKKKGAAFRRQARRDGLAIANSPYASADQQFVDAISAWDADA